MLRQLLVEAFIHVIEHLPVVGNLGPCAHNQCHLTLVEALHIDRRQVIGLGHQGSELGLLGLVPLLDALALPVEEALPPRLPLVVPLVVSVGRLLRLLLIGRLDVGIGMHDALVGGQDAEGNLTGHIHIVAITDAHAPLHAVIRLCAHILERTGGQTAVGNDDAVVVIGIDHGVEYLNLLDRALVLAKLDILAHLVGLQQQDEHATGKVLQRAAQRHADGHTGTGKDGDKRTGLDAQHTDHGDDEQEQQRHLDERQQERRQRALKALAHHDGARHAVDLVDDKLADVEDQDGSNDAQRQRNHLVRQRGHQTAHIQILELVHQFAGSQRRDRVGVQLVGQRVHMRGDHIGRLLDLVGRHRVGRRHRYLHQYLVQ